MSPNPNHIRPTWMVNCFCFLNKLHFTHTWYKCTQCIDRCEFMVSSERITFPLIPIKISFDDLEEHAKVHNCITCKHRTKMQSLLHSIWQCEESLSRPIVLIVIGFSIILYHRIYTQHTSSLKKQRKVSNESDGAR